MEADKAGKRMDKGRDEHSSFHICLPCQLVEWEIISICFLNPVLPLTNLLGLCLYGLFSKWHCELVEVKSSSWQMGIDQLETIAA